MPLSKQQRSIYEFALKHLESDRARLDNMITEIRYQLPNAPTAAVSTTTASLEVAPTKTRKKRTMSASARKRIAAAQKQRWAAYHKAQEKPEDTTEPTTKAVVKKATKKAPKKATAKKTAAKKAAKKTAKETGTSEIPL